MLIELKNICKTYIPNHYRALENINLIIPEGDLIAIEGVSGSGKTTLLNILGGIDRASSGKYYYENLEVSGLSVEELDLFRRNNICFVFQNFVLINNSTVAENIEIPLLAKRISHKERKDIIKDVADKVGLSSFLNTKVNRMSGGQQQRCAIARALASGNRFLLADEPTGSLDSKTSMEIMDLFETLNRNGQTIVIVTHNPKIAERCHHRIMLEDGKIVEKSDCNV